jgi:hypothetical protein
MVKCWNARRTQTPLEVPIGDPLVVQYTDFANDLVRYLDQMPVPRTTGAHEARRSRPTPAEHP